jgi:hypothetical protein
VPVQSMMELPTVQANEHASTDPVRFKQRL